MNVRVLGQHRKDCFAIDAVERGNWETPWAERAESKGLDAWGTKPGWHSWIEIQCNDPHCTARLLIRMAPVVRWAEAELVREREGRKRKGKVTK